MSSYTPPTNIIQGYNPSYFSSSTTSNYLTLSNADNNYFNASGGTFSGLISCQSGIATSGITDTGTFSTAGDIQSSGGVIRGTVQATSITNSGSFTNQGSITSTTGNITSTNGNIGGKVLQLTPVSTVGANQKTKIISFLGTFDSPQVTAYSAPSTVQTVTLDNCFRSGLLLGYLQANKKSDGSYLASYSFIATINYDTGIQGDSGFLSNTLSNYLDYKFLTGYPYPVQLTVKSPLLTYYLITSSNNFVDMAFTDSGHPDRYINPFTLELTFASEWIVRVTIPTGTYTYTQLASAFTTQIQSKSRQNNFAITIHPWQDYTVTVDSSSLKCSINPNPGYLQPIYTTVSFVSSQYGTLNNPAGNFTSLLGFYGNENMTLYNPMVSTNKVSGYPYESATLSYNFVVFNSD